MQRIDDDCWEGRASAQRFGPEATPDGKHESCEGEWAPSQHCLSHHGPYRPNERRDRKIYVNKDHIAIVRQRGFALTHNREVPVAR